MTEYRKPDGTYDYEAHDREYARLRTLTDEQRITDRQTWAIDMATMIEVHTIDDIGKWAQRIVEPQHQNEGEWYGPHSNITTLELHDGRTVAVFHPYWEGHLPIGIPCLLVLGDRLD